MTNRGDRDEAGEPEALAPHRPDSVPDDAVARGITAFQTAAGEMIGAARAMLDVAEDLVKDPNAAATVMRTLGSVAEGVTRFAANVSSTSDSKSDDDDEDDGGVRRITVS